jgi:hypothetical protein
MMHTYQTNVEMKKVSPITAVKDCFSESTFNMHIDGCAHAFGSINQVLKSEATVTSHAISTTVFQSLAFLTVATVCQLTHNLYPIVLSNNKLCSMQTLMLQQSQLPVTSDYKKHLHATLMTVKQKIQDEQPVTGNNRN